MRLERPLEKFVDALPILETLKPIRKTKKKTYYEVTMKEFRQKLHRDLRPTRLWGYESMFPGPTFEVRRDELVEVMWKNDLPASHFLPLDQTLHNVEGNPETRTVVHLHGGETPPHSDGHPDAWFTKDFKETGPEFTRKVYQYPNHQRASLLWYHDHAVGITRLNVYAGLAGLYLIRDEKEERLNLPKGDYEIPLVIQDRSFNEDGSLFYPDQPDPPIPNAPYPSVVPFFCGDTILVNGKVWPYLEVEPRKYRFRILNASNTRNFTLSLDSGQPFYQIGSDGGLFSKPVKVESIDMHPAERVDIIVDFSRYKGEEIILKNGSGCGGPVDPETDGNVMQFRVKRTLDTPDTSIIPKQLDDLPLPPKDAIQTVRNLKLIGSQDEFGRPLLLLDNQMWDDPVTEKPRVGDTEIWVFVNTTAFAHPMHVHLVQFQVLSHQAFDLDHYNETGNIVFTGPVMAPAPNNRGLKDTITVPPGSVTKIIAKFSPYTGTYVWHCHILEHEDYDMMRPFEVVQKKQIRKRKNEQNE
ncbi:copper oxidase [Pueribacillus theae]|uniref:Copper oxidase n=1 Tax=Pueribacillus theae TaxID=2171751 RepID=A0A2U1JM84_9BACI|nr:multicopper oxidase [Pueribacillus theae]PWA06277.1 copper oxidase [Pueribacillus theae]